MGQQTLRFPFLPFWLWNPKTKCEQGDTTEHDWYFTQVFLKFCLYFVNGN